MNTQVIIQARLGSERLPRKILCEVADGLTMLDLVVHRVSKATRIDGFIVATTTESGDDELAQYCQRKKWRFFRGSQSDVLGRYFQTAKHFGVQRIVRITSDCPMIDPSVIDRIISLADLSACDYASNVVHRYYPRGLDVEVFTFAALQRAHLNATEQFQREHVTPFINRQAEKFRIVDDRLHTDHSGYRWTVDTSEDLLMVRQLLGKIGSIDFTWTQALSFCEKHPEISRINQGVEQKPLRAA
jgi:spore coat polysaccharide biosynthesis protein SpsF